jgi:hypothetical protein
VEQGTENTEGAAVDAEPAVQAWMELLATAHAEEAVETPEASEASGAAEAVSADASPASKPSKPPAIDRDEEPSSFTPVGTVMDVAPKRSVPPPLPPSAQSAKKDDAPAPAADDTGPLDTQELAAARPPRLGRTLLMASAIVGIACAAGLGLGARMRGPAAANVAIATKAPIAVAAKAEPAAAPPSTETPSSLPPPAAANAPAPVVPAATTATTATPANTTETTTASKPAVQAIATARPSRTPPPKNGRTGATAGRAPSPAHARPAPKAKSADAKHATVKKQDTKQDPKKRR